MKYLRLYIAAAIMLFILSGVVIFNSLQSINPDDEKKPAPTEIDFVHWAYFPDEIFDLFHKEHPNIKINYEWYNVENYSRALRLRINSDEKTDVIGVLPIDYADFAINGNLMNLSQQSFLSGFKQDVRNAVKSKFDGAEYAVAYRSTYFGIWYNKTLFAKYGIKEPVNFEEFIKVCGTLKLNNINPLVLGAKDDASAMYLYLLPLFQLFDYPTWKSNYRSGIDAFDLPASRLKFYDLQMLVDHDYIDKNSVSLTYQQAFDYFKQSRAAMILAPDWSINMTGDDMEKVFEPGVFFIPYKENEIETKVPVDKADYLIGVYPGSDNVQESLAFLKFLSRPDVAQLYCDRTASYPTVKGVNIDALPYNRLWEPIRKMEGASADFMILSKENQAFLARKAKLFIAGSMRFEDLIDAFDKTYASTASR